MDGLQNQMVELNDKVDKIYHKVEELSYQIGELVSEKKHCSQVSGEALASLSRRIPPSGENHGNLNSVMEHKDIIADGSDWTNGDRHQNQTISPETQVRRLTAQLTAAYNRIAALEEQLLARHIHS